MCGVLIATTLGLTQAGLLRVRRIKQWTFYRRNEPSIAKIKQAILTKV